jgi:hypothetical protein
VFPVGGVERKEAERGLRRTRRCGTRTREPGDGTGRAPAASCVERSRQRERHARADGGRAGLVRRARCAALMIDF